MRRIANATYMSLDGVVQRPELWTFDYRSDDAAQVSHDQLFAAGALIMGRHTYDIFAAPPAYGFRHQRLRRPHERHPEVRALAHPERA
jgi:dihydrofolate reductase